jgi:hypothetical protein
MADVDCYVTTSRDIGTTGDTIGKRGFQRRLA